MCFVCVSLRCDRLVATETSFGMAKCGTIRVTLVKIRQLSTVSRDEEDAIAVTRASRSNADERKRLFCCSHDIRSKISDTFLSLLHYLISI